MPPLPLLHNFCRSPFRTTTLAISTAAATSTAQFIQCQFSNPRIFRGKPLKAAAVTGNSSVNRDQPSIVLDSLRVLQWDQLCDCVASFAGTTFGKQATKEQLWNLNKSYEGSIRLLEETKAAVEMHKYGAMAEFSGIDVDLVETGIKCARRGFPVSGSEASALLVLLRLAETLQLNVKAAIKEDSDWFRRFMPLSELIMELVISQPLIKFIEHLVDEDGSVKDSASSNLRHSRDRVRLLERKLYLLMESKIRNESEETSPLEICNVDGRWCIRSGAERSPTVEGLFLASGSGAGSLVEPLSAVPLNDELQQARKSVAKAEEEVLLKITKKMKIDLINIENIFNTMIQIDMINARARYSLSFEGACPDLYLPEDNDSTIHAETPAEEEILSQLTRKKWTLYLRRAYHPLLLQQHRHSLQMAMMDLSNANAEIRRRKQLGGSAKSKEDLNVSTLEMQVAKLKQALPVPFDIIITHSTRVLVITGPNTGGKTICLKTVGLAAMMAKSGLYVLASEAATIPWFDFILADIGDEQSLSQSLSTFSGHLKQISEIKCLSTNRSLVLLDEVGAGTNPLEGAALGMSLLESFADSGALLTIASTHHGELKSLKYRNNAFENACMEFDEVELKPTYRILWGVPGRSNAINIAERLGLPVEILNNARELYGAASAEINEVILDMEKFKQDYHEKVHQAHHYLKLSKKLHQSLLLTRNRVMEHGMMEKQMMVQEISKIAASARSVIHKKLRESRSLPTPRPKQTKPEMDNHASKIIHKHAASEENGTSVVTDSPHPVDSTKQSITEKKLGLPKAGDLVNVPSLNKKAAVLKVDPSKEEVVVQAGILKLKLKLADILPC
ncbi:DNA mismatch repair protein MutS [Perilla frutescens var. hirtella]|uniref:DNA mismatch repair protein MutS n=1 Tax=Perilla frutescens var. hirtella TaxID=608512 RepID=A0AAD4INS2_PERFH|nr:DNA mismatch repair protein MutS [Perilla frutescens var. hirtella]